MYFFNLLRKMFYTDCLYEVNSTQKAKDWKKKSILIIYYSIYSLRTNILKNINCNLTELLEVLSSKHCIY